MNEEKFLDLIPKVVINVEDVQKEVEAQGKIVKNGENFISHLTINHFLDKKLTDFDIEERLELFEELRVRGHLIYENGLYFNGLDIANFDAALTFDFEIYNMYNLDNAYIERLLKGEDITKQVVNVYGEDMPFAEILNMFVIKSGHPGDSATLLTMFTVKKALLGTYLAEQNIISLMKGNREIYDVSVLF